MAKREDTPVRVDNEVLRQVRIAASFKGKTLSEYISEALLPIAIRDMDEGYAREKQPKPPGKPSRRPAKKVDD